uniref:Golgin-84 n=1 Tax=Steinernema glaseri TaxID=37863 RepID=A0A1I7YBG0_9BILA
MSWLSNISNIADKAETLLNKLDQSTADVISKAPSRKGLLPSVMEELPSAGLSRDDDANSERSHSSSRSLRTASTQGSSHDLAMLASDKVHEDPIVQETAASSAMARSTDEKYQIMDFSWNRIQEEKQTLKDEIAAQNARIAKLEIGKREVEEELRSTKSGFAFQQREFEEYRTKAQRILQVKDDLLENLKKERGVEEASEASTGISTDIKTYELEQERDMLKEDVKSAQLAMLGLRSDMKDMEERVSEERRKFFAEKKDLVEKCQFWQNESKRGDEELSFLKSKFDQAREELKRERDYVNERLVQKEQEIRRLAEVERGRSGDAFATPGGDQRHLEKQVRSLADNLLEKQNLVERLHAENRALSLQLENSNKKQRSYADRDAFSVDMGVVHRFSDSPELRTPLLGLQDGREPQVGLLRHRQNCPEGWGVHAALGALPPVPHRLLRHLPLMGLLPHHHVHSRDPLTASGKTL